MNPFIQLQNQLRDVIAAHEYFAGVPILTEELANIESKLDIELAKLGLCVVITTARGQRLGDDEPAPAVLTEELTAAIIHNPLMESAYTALDALAEAIAAIEAENHQHLVATATCPWRILGHDFVEDAPAGLVTHHLRVSTPLRF
ncbi:hypothetical protein OH491_13535 [Termitidicoccus mucosus]|uniref:Uncharacterized protein n=1 Tax=Termitidicoccus mucosus TaxID=1184151 RepID=A0A178IH69_9BACT|nr:hypothetical protein AW736_13910 [Opitutaceae bacterium TSB47]